MRDTVSKASLAYESLQGMLLLHLVQSQIMRQRRHSSWEFSPHHGKECHDYAGNPSPKRASFYDVLGLGIELEESRGGAQKMLLAEYGHETKSSCTCTQSAHTTCCDFNCTLGHIIICHLSSEHKAPSLAESDPGVLAVLANR